jgi:hypothetical protein
MLTGVNVQVMGLHLREDLLEEATRNWHRAGLTDDQIQQRQTELQALLAETDFTNAAIQTLNRNIFDRAIQVMDRQFAEQPQVRAQLKQTLADTLRNLTLLERATSLQAEALEIRKDTLGQDNSQTLESLHSSALLLAAQGKWDQAEPIARDLLERSQRLSGENRRPTLNAKRVLADALQRRGRLDEAEPLRRQVLEGYVNNFPNDDPETIDARLRLGQALLWQYRLPEAEPLLKQALEDMHRVFGDGDARTWGANGTFGNLLLQQEGKLLEAEKCFRESYQNLRKIYGDQNRETLFWKLKYGEAILNSRDKDRLGEAETQLQGALQGLEAALLPDEPNHHDLLLAHQAMGELRLAQTNWTDAETHFQKAVDGFRSNRSQAESSFVALVQLGIALEKQWKWKEAAPYFADLYKGAPLSQLPQFRVAHFMSYYGPCLVRLEDYANAEPALSEAYNRLKVPGNDRRQRMPFVLSALAAMCDHTNHPTDAAKWRAELAAWRATTRGQTRAPATAPAEIPVADQPN